MGGAATRGLIAAFLVVGTALGAWAGRPLVAVRPTAAEAGEESRVVIPTEPIDPGIPDAPPGVRLLRAAPPSADNPAVVDVLVAYDSAAAEWTRNNFGGTTNFAALSVAKMNAAFAPTYLADALRFRLVGVAEVPVDGRSDFYGVLDDVQSGVGAWAGVKRMRDAVGADVVSTLIDTGSAFGTTGLGFALNTTDYAAFSENAYSVCSVRAVASGHTMTHEVGHNLGAGHATAVNTKRVTAGPQLFDYSAGHYFTGTNGVAYHTIMAYNSDYFGGFYEPAPVFSSPDTEYMGAPAGDGEHDNLFTIAQTCAAAAAWRGRKVDDADAPGAGMLDHADLGLATDAPQLAWRTTTESFPWTLDEDVSFDGVSSARSGWMNESSGASTRMETVVAGPARMSFRYRKYFASGAFVVYCGSSALFKDSEPGTADRWRTVEVEVPQGEHVVSFSYTQGKSCYVDAETEEYVFNGVWVDRVLFGAEFAAQPELSPATDDSEYAATTFSGELEVTISAPGGFAGEIRYTLDRTSPLGDGALVYGGPFAISNSTLVRAVCVEDGKEPGEETVGVYLERHAVAPGEWTADADGAMAAAAVDGRMLAVMLTDIDDPDGAAFAPVAESAEFLDWAASNDVYLVVADSSRFVESDKAELWFWGLMDTLCGGYCASAELPGICFTRAGAPYRPIASGAGVAGAKIGSVVYDGTVESLVAGFASALAIADSPELYTLKLRASPSAAGKAYGGGGYAPGKTVPLKAAPKKGYAFTGWYDAAGKRLSLEPSYGFVMPDRDAVLTAKFKKISKLKKPTLRWNGEKWTAVSGRRLKKGRAYSAVLTASGEAKVYIKGVKGLPTGLSYRDGAIAGKPRTRGVYTVRVTVALAAKKSKTWTYRVRLVVR